MKAPTSNSKATIKISEGMRSKDDLITWIAALAKEHGSVFQLPAARPTFVFSGHEALAMLDDPELVDRDPSVVPAGISIFEALCDEDVSPLSLTNGEEHLRRRASWSTPGNLDREGILKALPVLSNIIDETFHKWEKQGIFSLNQEVRRAVWRIASQLTMGSTADDQLFADYETFMGLNGPADVKTARQNVVNWLELQVDAFQTNDPIPDFCIAAKLAQSNTLTKPELINEVKHGLGSVLFNWIPLTELMRQLAVDNKPASLARNEIAALENNFQPKAMASTPHLVSMIETSLRVTSPLPFFFARAKTAFSFEGVAIPAKAVLIGSFHATNQLNEIQEAGATEQHSPHVAFGLGSHRCPGADLSTIILWLFAARFLSNYNLQCLDEKDLPTRQNSGFFAPRGCFVKFSRDSGNIEPIGEQLDDAPIVSPLSVDRASRIAIVGAGITGLTLAHELRKSGYGNITVFERAPSIGGKADTVEIDGLPYNLGAHLCHGSLGVASLAQEVGVELERAPTYELWDIDQNQAIPRSYEHYAQVEKLRQLMAENPELDNAAGFAATESWTYSSISSWLDAHELGDLREIGPFFTGAGYGFLDEDVPAAFFLKFAQHMTEDGWTPAGGYKHLLERVSAGLNVRCDTEVVKVQRDATGNPSSPTESIRISTRRSAATEEIKTEEFDRLILAGPLEHAEQYLDLSSQENALFSRIKSLDYYTVLATLDIEHPHEPGLYIVPKNTGCSEHKGSTTAFERAFEESKVYHFFCYGEPGQSEETILENVRKDARLLGGEIAQVHVFKKWAYAPQVSPHDMALGFHRRLDNLQGQLGTYYAGSLLAFELTDHNVLQAKSLVARFFGNSCESKTECERKTTALPEIANTAIAKTAHIDLDSSPDSRIPENGTQSILDILRDRYQRTPNSILSTFLDAKGKSVRALTYKELTERAMACAISLKAKGVKAGDRVALVYPPDTDEFLIGFFGCLMAEAIAVPVACPDPRKLDIEIPRFAHLMNDCDCRVALTTRMYYAIALAGRTWSRITNLTSDRKIVWPKLIWISTDGLSPIAPSIRQPIPSPSADTVAYLQYTSGSTSDPKGVIINHGNVLHNVDAICRQTNVKENSVLLGWVPLFHDMGLVGGPLTTIYCGAQLVFFSPVSFLQNPVLWVKAMHQYRATHTESPNFGYEFLLRHLDDESLKGIDLSCLKHVLFGGEVMRHRTFERLAERLHGTGFRPEAMTNIFGAAEATLFLAGGGLENTPLLSVDTLSLELKRRAVPRSPDSRSSTTLIGCGIPSVNSDLRIVDPINTRLLPDGEVGEVWLSSPSVSQGYWGRSQEQNDAIFKARVANDPAPLRTYLRTGDLGFIERGVLYICGRVKEMMIFNGRNIHPMDIELCIMNAHPAIRQGCVVAFSIEEEEQEKLVVVAEIKNSALEGAADASESIARELSEQHNLASKAILLVRSGTLPKTSSGKLQRYRAREEYIGGKLDLIHTLISDKATSIDVETSGLETENAEAVAQLNNAVFSGDVFATRQWLQRLIALSLHVAPEEVSTSTSFSMFGIDSAQALTMTTRISAFIGHKLTPSVLYEQPNIDALALYLCSKDGMSQRVLVQLQQGDPDKFPKLFCVHPVGGNAMAYLGLVDKLPNHIPVCAFGNESDEVPSDDLVAMAQRYVAEMQAVQYSGPYYLLGYSFGGTVAYEMARQILAAGGEIGGLFLIDSPAPLYIENELEPISPEQDTYADFLNTAILNHLIPDQLDDEEREKLRLRIDQNHQALSHYRIEPTDSIRPQMIMFRATDEAEHLRDSTRHPAFDRPDFGWEEAAPESVQKVIHVPGDHFSVMNEPVLLAELLVAHLGENAAPTLEGNVSDEQNQNLAETDL